MSSTCSISRGDAEMIYKTVSYSGLIWRGSFTGDVVTKGGTSSCASQCSIQFRPGKFGLFPHLFRDGDEVRCFGLSDLSVDLFSECLVSIPGGLGSGLQVLAVVVVP